MFISHGESTYGNRPDPPEKASEMLNPKRNGPASLTWEIHRSIGAVGCKLFKAEAPGGCSQVHGYLPSMVATMISIPTSPSTHDFRSKPPEKGEKGSYENRTGGTLL